MAIHKTVKMFRNSGFSSFLRLSSNRSLKTYNFCKQGGARSKSFLRTFISESKPSASNANGGALVEKSELGKNQKKKKSSLKSCLRKILFWTGIGATTYACNVETVPCSNRTHFILVPRIMEKWDGEEWGEKIKEKNKARILSESDPTSFRVRMITEKLVDAAEKDLRDGNALGVGPIYALSRWKHALMVFLYGQQSTNEFRASRYLSHMENWEVIVADYPGDINVLRGPGGKILVTTGLLRSFNTDSEIAAIIAHEVGHALARHYCEPVVYYIWLGLTIPLRVLYTFNMDVFSEDPETHSWILRLSKKLDLEADYIGLRLMTSAGYEPRTGMAMEWKLLRIAKQGRLP